MEMMLVAGRSERSSPGTRNGGMRDWHMKARDWPVWRSRNCPHLERQGGLAGSKDFVGELLDNQLLPAYNPLLHSRSAHSSPHFRPTFVRPLHQHQQQWPSVQHHSVWAALPPTSTPRRRMAPSTSTTSLAITGSFSSLTQRTTRECCTITKSASKHQTD